MIKILHLLDTPGPGGAERLFVTLVEKLDPKRFKSYGGVLCDGWAAKELRDREIEPVLITNISQGADPFLSLKILKAAKRLGVDMIHCHLHDTNIYGSLAAFLGRVPSIATHHDTSVIHGMNNLRRRVKFTVLRRFPTAHVCVAATIGQSLVNVLGIPRGSVAHIHNGVEKQEFPPSELQSLRESLSIPQGTFVFGCVGNLYNVKGQDILLEAFAKVKAHGRNMRLLLLGRGECEPQLRAQCEKLGLTEEVQFLGFRSDARALLHLIDCMVIPSRSEGLPMVLLEAFATGLPVVSTRVGGVPEVIRDGQNGFLVPPEDPARLAERMIQLAENELLRHKLGTNAARDFEKQWSLERMISRYEVLYETLAATPRPSRAKPIQLTDFEPQIDTDEHR